MANPVAGPMGGATVSGLSAICRQLTNPNDINRLLYEVVAKERAIDAELEQQLTKRADIERNLLYLNSSTTEILELMRVDSEQLQSSVKGTARLAEKVSSKVRELDIAGSAVEESLSRINLIIDRSNCIDGTKSAMETEDYEAAARYISTYSQLDGKTRVLEDGQTEEEQMELLNRFRDQLVEVVRMRFKEAVKARDHAAVVRFTKLFVPLSLHKEGLSAFTGYLCQLIASRATEDYSSLADTVGENVSAADFVGVLTNLFKDIAIAVEENEALLQESFDTEGVLFTIQQLQNECDNTGSKILRRYLEHRQLQRLVREISGSKRSAEPNLTSPDRKAAVDPRQVELFLGEIVMLSQRSEEYNQFMLAKLREAAGNDVVGASSRESTFRGGQFNCTVREVIGYYITMEEYYVEEMIAKAVRFDELAPGQLVSSMVDDTFFIFQKCAQRSLATGSLQCGCAVLSELNNLMSGAYRTAVGNKLANCAQRLVGDMPSDTILAEATFDMERPHEVSTSINCAEISGTYVTKLRQELEHIAMEMFPAAQDRERVKSCLADLAKTSSDFHSLAAKALNSVASGLFPRLRAQLDEVSQMSYQPSEAEYAAMEMEEMWTQRLLVAMEACLSWLRPQLIVPNYETLISHLVDKVAGRLEAILAKKSFNQLGGLQLDRDVRNLVSHLSEFTQRTIRDKFARLTQMATVLSLETPSEILDYWGENSGPITWRFTAQEVRELLRMRVDFTPTSLQQLSL
mmetsp:Transcript_26/g.78  ORF Transcript_26/g.78 Transcript_26/m.78 type:complete len:746 (+) Transcript_26:194-2431(+)